MTLQLTVFTECLPYERHSLHSEMPKTTLSREENVIIWASVDNVSLPDNMWVIIT